VATASAIRLFDLAALISSGVSPIIMAVGEQAGARASDTRLFIFSVCFFCFFGLLYGVAHHWNGISDSSSSASESVVQSFDDESVVQSFDESSNKRRHNLVLTAAAGKGESGKYGVETTLTVSSPFVSRIGEMAD